ncbi:hypothetical protein METBIDRAFT_201688 [Metschnikowia bicuspidata var. bicuspidata NRRL YB-4993]|uniref:Transcription factor domain-containing protein n=1 Tax=Metschnikowia bicuspidata var. bicuspidata NRRL YB-4993 TaxID=869754 RepID=A0A1A0H9S6_9ASCO|nr:hypothetical protein METBIDRAFT_201688 [Metschnikowia bicuspidata var. bicuspidata NRRL YB-4993]OBA20628.1 hypothetical protein METBIDRAFT_201688 [Metschnikowia bicuspidata var. bicuspidata NRRL YB-4993]
MPPHMPYPFYPYPPPGGPHGPPGPYKPRDLYDLYNYGGAHRGHPGPHGPRGPHRPPGFHEPYGHHGPHGLHGLHGPHGPHDPHGPHGPRGQAGPHDQYGSRAHDEHYGPGGPRGPHGPHDHHGPYDPHDARDAYDSRGHESSRCPPPRDLLSRAPDGVKHVSLLERTGSSKETNRLSPFMYGRLSTLDYHEESTPLEKGASEHTKESHRLHHGAGGLHQPSAFRGSHSTDVHVRPNHMRSDFEECHREKDQTPKHEDKNLRNVSDVDREQYPRDYGPPGLHEYLDPHRYSTDGGSTISRRSRESSSSASAINLDGQTRGSSKNMDIPKNKVHPLGHYSQQNDSPRWMTSFGDNMSSSLRNAAGNSKLPWPEHKENPTMENAATAPSYASLPSTRSPSPNSSRPSDTYATSRVGKDHDKTFGTRRKTHFKSSDLLENDLPPEETLLSAIDFYYVNLHPNYLLLPPKAQLFKWFLPSSESSIYHAILANVCNKKKLPADPRESFWIDNMFRRWDDLNDFGMLLCYGLTCRAFSVRSNSKSLSAYMSNISLIVENNRFFETLQIKRGDLNPRKTYERECVIRVIWGVWSIQTLERLRDGYPYAPAQTDFYANSIGSLTFAEISASIPLPLSSTSFNELDDSRRLTCESLIANNMDDVNCVIKAILMLRNTLDRVASGEFIQNEIVKDKAFENVLRNESYSIKTGVIILNACCVKANMIWRCSNLTQNLYFMKNVMLFDRLMVLETTSSGTSKVAYPRIDFIRQLSESDLMNLEQLGNNIANMSEFQWGRVLDMMNEIKQIFEILLLHMGVSPLNAEANTPVHYYTHTFSINHLEEYEHAGNEEDAFLKGSEVLDLCLSILIALTASFIILRCFAQITKVEGGYKVLHLKHSTRSPVFLPSTNFPDVAPFFDHAWLASCFEKAARVLKFRLQHWASDEFQLETVSNIHGIGHCMEVIVERLK